MRGTWQSRREYQIALYHKGRASLVEELGGVCKDCGTTEKLEFDHKDGNRTWVASKVARWVRLANYRREAEQGLIELRCGTCNKKKGRKRPDPTGVCGFCDRIIPEGEVCSCTS